MMLLAKNEGISETDFQELFEEYFEQVKRFVYYKSGDEGLASDIAQEVFLKVWEKRRKVKKETVKALLYTTAERLFVNKWRKSKIELKFLRRTNPQAVNDESPEDNYTYQQTKATYEKILSEMPEKQREVFLMSRIDELKYKEIAENLQIGVKAVEKRMSKALERLRAELEV